MTHLCRRGFLAFFLSGAILLASDAAAAAIGSGAVTKGETGVTPASELSNLFADPNLQACIDRLASDKSWYYVQDVKGRIQCDKQRIADLSGIEFLSGVTALELSVNAIDDLSPLSALPRLTSLKLGFNRLTDIKPLAELTNLRVLTLDNNSISDISALANLNRLAHLNLQNNLISDLRPLSVLSELEHLNLGLNNIKRIEPLADLSELEYLSLLNNNVSDIRPLNNLINLRGLNLRGNKIADINSLTSLRKLSNVNLSDNAIGGYQRGHVEVLAALPNILHADLSGNTFISCTELDTLIDQLNTTPDPVVIPRKVEQGETCDYP